MTTMLLEYKFMNQHQTYL